MFLILLIVQIFCQQNFIILDELPIGYEQRGTEICNENECYPLDFEAANEFQIIKPGQRIPKGLHISMDYQTNVKKAKLMDAKESTDLNVAEDPIAVPVKEPVKEPNQKDEKEPVIIPHESRNMSTLTLEEVKTLEELFGKMNSTEPQEISESLEILSDAVHQIDIGAGLTASERHVEFLVLLMHNQDIQVCSQSALVLGTAVSNNPLAQQNVIQVDGILEKLLKRFASLPTGVCKTRMLFLLTSLTRNPDILPQFLVFDALNLMLEQAESDGLLLKLLRYMNDISPLVLETDLDKSKWCDRLLAITPDTEELYFEAQLLLSGFKGLEACQQHTEL